MAFRMNTRIQYYYDYIDELVLQLYAARRRIINIEAYILYFVET